MTEKRLYRSVNDRVLAGVCGGLSEYLGVDSTLIRIVFILLTMLNGVGVLLYIILAVITPAEDKPQSEPRENLNDLASAVKQKANNLSEDMKRNPNENGPSKARMVIGLLLCVFGSLMLIKNFIPAGYSLFVFWLDRLIWPAILLLAGFYFISKK